MRKNTQLLTLFILLLAFLLTACDGGDPTATPLPAEPTETATSLPQLTETAVPAEQEEGYPAPLPTATLSDGSYPALPTLAPPTAYPEP